MEITEIIQQLREKQIFISVDNDELVIKSENEITKSVISLLKENKQDLISYIKNQSVKSDNKYPVIIEDDYPVSNSQKRIWFLSQFEDSNIAYNMGAAYKISGEISASKIEDSFVKLIERHQSLRTTFIVNSAGEPRQVISEMNDFSFSIQNKSISRDQIKNEINNLYDQPFDLENEILIRVALLKISPTEHILIYVIHHIIGDGWSLNVIIEDLFKLYSEQTSGIDQLEPLQFNFKDYVYWKNKKEKDLTVMKEFWLQTFSDLPEPINLPTDFQRKKVKTYNGDIQKFVLERKYWDAIKDYCKINNITPFIFVLGAVHGILYKYSGQKDIVIGSPNAGRNDLNLKDQVGFFVNTLPLRLNPNMNNPFSSVLSEIKRTVIDSFNNSDYSMDSIINDIKLPRDPSRNPLFDVLVAFQNFEKAKTLSNNFSVKIEELTFEENHKSKFDLTFYIYENNDELEVDLEYNTDLFNLKTIMQFGNHLISLFRKVSETPSLKIKNIDILSPDEENTLLTKFNNTDKAFDEDLTFNQLFKNQVEKKGNKVAVVYKDNQLTYDDLNNLSNQFGHYLQSEKNIQSGDKVVVNIERSFEMVIAILALMKIGAAYVPVDIKTTQSNLDYIKGQTQSKVILNELFFQSFEDVKNNYSSEDFEVNISSESILYIIYTSGSTGNPKGCILTHKGVHNRINWMWNRLSYSENDIVLQKTNYSFDVSVWEIFMPLCFGCKMILCPSEVVLDPIKLSHIIEKEEVSSMHFVPTMFDSFINGISNTKGIGSLETLRNIVLSGEALSINTVNNWYKINTTKLYNLYGPTEASIDVTYYPVQPNTEKVYIGKPIDNTQIYIVDDNLNLAPIGVMGEIYLGGVGLAQGYLGEEELTSKHFINNPFGTGKIYKTGDFGKWSVDGNIEYIGRKDNQVKIRGFRIELESIVNAIESVERVEQVKVLCKKFNTGDVRLVAFIKSDNDISFSEIKDKLRNQLKPHEIPNHFVSVDHFPVNKNGKLDTKILLNLPVENISKEYIPPCDELEASIQSIYQDVLGIDKISVVDSFFELGGTSFNIIVLKNRIQEIDVDVDIDEIFSNPSIRDLCNNINTKQSNIQSHTIEIIEL